MGRKPTSTPTQGDYLAYLLRIWREGKGRTPWRASLQSPHTGQTLGFGSLGEMFGFLQRQLSLQPGDQTDPTGEKWEEIGGPPSL